MLVQVYGVTAMKIKAVYNWMIRFFWRKSKCHWRREIRTASNKQNWRKHCKSSSSIKYDTRFSFTLTCFDLYWSSSEGYLSVYISTVQRLLPMF
jgi:hypothetical protein